MDATRPAAKRSLCVVITALLAYACAEEKESCVLSPIGNGAYRLSCPDGVSGTFVPPDSAEAPAVVTGTARRLGERDEGGVEVTLQPTFPNAATHQTTTAPDGTYRFEGVASGIYHLIFRSPGYPNVVLWQRAVLPGTLRLDPVVLRPTRRIGPVSVAAIHVAPTQDALVAHEKEQGRLFYWDEGLEEALLLGDTTSKPRWLPSGRGVLYLNAFTGISGTLAYFDRARGTSVALMADVVDWSVSEDEQLVVAQLTQNRLITWRAVDGEVTTIVASGLTKYLFHPHSKLIAAHVTAAGRTGPDVLVWDSVASSGSLLGRATNDALIFDGRGEVLLYASSGRYFVWRRDLSAPLPLGSTADAVRLSPDGRFVVRRPAGSAVAQIVDTGETIPIVAAPDKDGFDPRTGSYWVESKSPPSLKLFHADGSLETLHTWSSETLVAEPFFPKDSGKIFFVLGRSGLPTRSLRVWEPGEGSRLVADGLVDVPILLADERHLLFQIDRPYLLDVATEAKTPLRTAGDVTLYVDSHERGLFHFPLTPLYSSFQTVGAMVVYDATTHEEAAVVDEIYQETCRFSPVGELHCLSRRSPIPPYGARLVVWDPVGRQMRQVADGVLAFGFAKNGARAWVRTQTPEGVVAPMLWLRDPQRDVMAAIDTGVGTVALTDGWIAYAIPEGERKGLYVSRYPDAFVEDGP